LVLGTQRHDCRLLRVHPGLQRPDFSNQNAYDLAQLGNRESLQ